MVALVLTTANTPDLGLLQTAVAPVKVAFLPPFYHFTQAADFTAAQQTALQATLDTTAVSTPQRVAQTEIDQYPIAQRALVLALIDQLNVIRAALPVPLPAITPAQALTAIRNKAATLA